MDYDYLREEYPDMISMEQLYQICHISKRKALWLLEHGVIPCEDSGKQTRRFRIWLEDTIDFLTKRDAGDLDEVIPRGEFSSGCYAETKPLLDSETLFSLFMKQWQNAPDMLTAKQAEALCGYGTTSINRWLQLGNVKGVLYYGANLISKESLAEYLASPEGQRISVKSEAHRLPLDECYAEQQNSDMAFCTMLL
jgi:hypothetical protein